MKKSIMWDYIYEEEERLKDLLKSDQIQQLIKQDIFKEVNKIILVASGSSLNIGTVAKKIYEDVASVEMITYTPSNFCNSRGFLSRLDRRTTLIIAISQTGTSSGTVNSINLSKELGFKVLTLTERRDTPVEEQGDYYLNFLCGLEDCNAKSKGYSNSMTLLILLGLNIAKEKKLISEKIFGKYVEEIENSIYDLKDTINNTLFWIENHKDWATINHLLTIGYGMNYGAAVEGMLKIVETLCVLGSVTDIGEFSHGFHRAINSNSNVIGILTEEDGRDEMIKASVYLKNKVKRLLIINASKEKVELDSCIEVPHRPLTASCINIAVVFQLIAVALPEIIGQDPNYPINEDYTMLVNTRVQ